MVGTTGTTGATGATGPTGPVGPISFTGTISYGKSFPQGSLVFFPIQYRQRVHCPIFSKNKGLEEVPRPV